jgi:hypothetical protein
MKKRIECDNCGYETQSYLLYEEDGKKYCFCEICDSTFLSKATKEPMVASESRLFKSMGWIANKIIDTIKEKENGR